MTQAHAVTPPPQHRVIVRSGVREWYEPLLERGLIPDSVLRAGIRRRLRSQLDRLAAGGPDAVAARHAAFKASLDAAPVAIETDAANAQHYELPPEFFLLCLGPRLKYSGCVWDPGDRVDASGLARAEERTLELYAHRARLADGQRVLDLGCGWGSFSLWAAERFPRSSVLAVSNSAGQRRFIEARAAQRGLSNLRVITRDASTLTLDERFDRIVSVEMLEHMKNYRDLLGRLASWLSPGGLLFVHIFTHARFAYHFEADDNWVGRYFFTGGTMPSDDLLTEYQDDLRPVERWRVDGTHYQRTANAWLANLDAHRSDAMRVLRLAYGPAQARAWLHRWRVFFMSCAELWGLDAGREWLVSHYLFEPRRP
jgi:cyclopropane-fatty-acyl-phospholipid synthase